jgi:hypothetical protein
MFMGIEVHHGRALAVAGGRDLCVKHLMYHIFRSENDVTTNVKVAENQNGSSAAIVKRSSPLKFSLN